jgi:hypothetical protein
MGHNDIDYEHGTNKDLSNTFDSDVQNKFLITSLQWLGDGNKSKPSVKNK